MRLLIHNLRSGGAFAGRARSGGECDVLGWVRVVEVGTGNSRHHAQAQNGN